MSTAISTTRVGCTQTRTIGFGNTQPATNPASNPTVPIINHNMQPFFGNSILPIASQGMYFRGSLVGTRLNVLG